MGIPRRLPARSNRENRTAQPAQRPVQRPNQRSNQVSDQTRSQEARFLFRQLFIHLQGFDVIDDEDYQTLQDADLETQSRRIPEFQKKLHQVKSRIHKQPQVSAIRLSDIEDAEETYLQPCMKALASGISYNTAFSRLQPKPAHAYLLDALVGMRILGIRTSSTSDPLLTQPQQEQVRALPALRASLVEFLANPPPVPRIDDEFLEAATESQIARRGEAKAAKSCLDRFEDVVKRGQGGTLDSSTPGRKRREDLNPSQAQPSTTGLHSRCTLKIQKENIAPKARARAT